MCLQDALWVISSMFVLVSLCFGRLSLALADRAQRCRTTTTQEATRRNAQFKEKQASEPCSLCGAH